VNFNGVTESYFDSFQIRYWDKEFVLNVLSEYEFSVEVDHSVHFAATGSNYFLMKKGERND
jgi:hypothetical protein